MDFLSVNTIEVDVERTPLICLHPDKPSLLVRTKDAIVEYDVFNGFILNTFEIGSIESPVGMSIGRTNDGKTFFGLVDKGGAADVYSYDRSCLYMSYPPINLSPEENDTAFITMTNGDKPFAVVGCTTSAEILAHDLSVTGPDKVIILDDDTIIPAKSPCVGLSSTYVNTTSGVVTGDNLIHIWKYGGELTVDGQLSKDDFEYVISIDLDGGRCADNDRLSAIMGDEDVRLESYAFHPIYPNILTYGLSNGRLALFSIDRSNFQCITKCECEIVSVAFHPNLPIILVQSIVEKQDYIEIYQRMETYKEATNDYEYDMKFYKRFVINNIIKKRQETIPKMIVHHLLNVIIFAYRSGHIEVVQMYDLLRDDYSDSIIATNIPLSVEYYIEGQNEKTTTPFIMPPAAFYIEHKEDYFVTALNFFYTMKVRPALANNSLSLNDIPTIPTALKDKNVAPLISYIRPSHCRISVDGRSAVLFIKTLEGTSTYNDYLFVVYNISDSNLIAQIFRPPDIFSTDTPPYLFIGFPCLEPCKDVLPLHGQRVMILGIDGRTLKLKDAENQVINELIIDKKKKKDKKDKKSKEERMEVSLNMKVEQIIYTHKQTKHGPILMYLINDGTPEKPNWWLIYSDNKNKSSIRAPDCYQISGKLKKSSAFNVGGFKLVKHVVFQKVTGDQIPLFAVVASNGGYDHTRLFILNSDTFEVILNQDIHTIFEPMWVGYSLVYPSINGAFYYLTLKGIERPFCNLDQNLTNPKIVGIFPDRFLYMARNKYDLTENVVQKGFNVAECFIVGLLETPSDLLPDNYLEKAVRRYMPIQQDTSESVGYNSGISETLFNRLIAYKCYRYAYSIIKSPDPSNIYLPHISATLKALPSLYLHSFKDSLYELLSDNQSILEVIKQFEANPSTNVSNLKLPHPKSQLSSNLRFLSLLASLGGDFPTAKLCSDLAGDDWTEIRTLVSSCKSNNFYEQIAKRSQNTLHDIFLMGNFFYEKKSHKLKSKPEVNPIEHTLRHYCITNIDNSTIMTYEIEQNVERSTPLKPLGQIQSAGPGLLMSSPAVWLQGVNVVEKELNKDDKDEAADEGPVIGVEGEDSIVGYWRFDEQPDERDEEIKDISKFLNNGTLYGKYKYEESDSPVEQGDENKVKKQYMMFFRGGLTENDLAQVVFRFQKQSTLSLGFGESDNRRKCFTIEMWIKPRQPQGILLARGKSIDDFMWMLYIEEGELFFATPTGKVNTYPQGDSPNILEDEWTHIAASLDNLGEKPKVSLFINGEQLVNNIITPPEEEKPPEKRDRLLLAPDFQGRLTEFRYWASLRTSDMINDMKYTHLDMAEAKKKIQVEIHPKDCKCEKCQKRKELSETGGIKLSLAPIAQSIGGFMSRGRRRG